MSFFCDLSRLVLLELIFFFIKMFFVNFFCYLNKVSVVTYLQSYETKLMLSNKKNFYF